jgi:hypothetical protein
MACHSPYQVFVLLFGVASDGAATGAASEGIYSLRSVDSEGLPQETILAFEDDEEAQRYAGLLEATMPHTPSICAIPPTDLLSFCLESQYSCRLEVRWSVPAARCDASVVPLLRTRGARAGVCARSVCAGANGFPPQV